MDRLFPAAGLVSPRSCPPGCGRQHTPKPAVPPLRVGAAAAAVTDSVPNRMSFIGYLASNFDAVIQPRVNGFLSSKRFTATACPYGAGSCCSRSTPTSCRPRCWRPKPNSNRPRAQALEARNNYDRAVPLAQASTPSASRSWTSTRPNGRPPRPRCARRSSRCSNARMNVGYTELRSPIDGIIEHTAAHVGDYVGPGTQFSVLTTVSNIDTLTVDVAIPMVAVPQRYAGATGLRSTTTKGCCRTSVSMLADGSRYPLRRNLRLHAQGRSSTSTGTLVRGGDVPQPRPSR